LGYKMPLNLFVLKLFQQIQEKDKDYIKNIFDFLNESNFINNERMLFIKSGLDLYEKKEYVGCIHILTFQIEAALRDVLLKFDIPTFSYKTNGEMRARMLDDVINALKHIQGFEKDFLEFLFIFLVDLRGDNLRNDLAHGLCTFEELSKENSTLLILILIKLASYKMVPLEHLKNKTDTNKNLI